MHILREHAMGLVTTIAIRYRGDWHAHDALIDTGFNACLMVPPQFVDKYRLRVFARRAVLIADGEQSETPVASVKYRLPCFREPIQTEAFVMGSMFTVGMAVLGTKCSISRFPERSVLNRSGMPGDHVTLLNSLVSKLLL